MCADGDGEKSLCRVSLGQFYVCYLPPTSFIIINTGKTEEKKNIWNTHRQKLKPY